MGKERGKAGVESTVGEREADGEIVSVGM